MVNNQIFVKLIFKIKKHKIMKKIDKILKETERAKLVLIDNKKYWIPNKHIQNDSVDDEEFKLEELIEEKMKIKVEISEHSERSYKVQLQLDIEGHKKEKLGFLPKSKVNIENECIVIEPFFWNSMITGIFDSEIEYQNKFQKLGKKGDLITNKDNTTLIMINEDNSGNLKDKVEITLTGFQIISNNLE